MGTIVRGAGRSVRTRATALAALVSVALAPVACAQQGAPAPEPVWRTEPVPSRTGAHDRSELSTVVTVDGSSWALGTWDAPTPQGGRLGGALAYQRGPDGQWREYPVPYRYSIEGSAARAADDIWAAVSPGHGPPLHFDGTRWDGAATGAENRQVEAFTEIGGEIWGVGPPSVLRWDGTTWAPLDRQPPYRVQSASGMSGSSPHDVWFLGRVRGDTPKASNPVVAHYDGAGWVDTPLPPIRALHLNDIASLAPDDAWAVGRRSQQQYAHPVALHYDGDEWTEQELPFTRGLLTGLAIIGGRPWAVGVSYDDPVTLVLRLGPDGWERVPGTPVGEARDLTALPDGRPLVVGTVPVGEDAALPLAARPDR